MKTFIQSIVLGGVLALTATAFAPAQAQSWEQRQRWEERRHEGNRHDGNRHDGNRWDNNRRDRWEERRRWQERHGRSDRYDRDNRRPVVIYRPAYPSYGYGYDRYSYNGPLYYQGNRYVNYRGRYYDQCSRSDRQAAALVGLILGSALGNQITDDSAGAITGAVIGGAVGYNLGNRC